MTDMTDDRCILKNIRVPRACAVRDGFYKLYLSSVTSVTDLPVRFVFLLSAVCFHECKDTK